MRIQRRPGSIQPRRWVRRWMLVTAFFLIEIPGQICLAFQYTADEAAEFADQYNFEKKKK